MKVLTHAVIGRGKRGGVGRALAFYADLICKSNMYSYPIVGAAVQTQHTYTAQARNVRKVGGACGKFDITSALCWQIYSYFMVSVQCLRYAGSYWNL